MYRILAHLELLPTFATTLFIYFYFCFIDIIHSTENKAIKEGTTSVNSNYKSSHVASNFMVICIMLEGFV